MFFGLVETMGHRQEFYQILSTMIIRGGCSPSETGLLAIFFRQLKERSKFLLESFGP